MAIKKGLAFYRMDTDKYQDKRIKRLKKEFKRDGVAVYDYILCEIYRVDGCYILWDESTTFDVADYWDMKETTVNEIVNYCCAVGLFNKELLISERVLTSPSIQHRYTEMCLKAKRKDYEIPEKYLITPEEIPKTPEVLPFTPEVLDIVEKSKEEKSKVVSGKPPQQADLEIRRGCFYDTLKDHLLIYGKDVLRNFFDYWREPNKSQTKMRFEQEKTWDLELRLKRWASNDFSKDKKPLQLLTGPSPSELKADKILNLQD